MGKKLVHTPEGVRDIYGDEYARKLQLENFIMGKVRSFGYEDIQTPTFEFFDIFGKEIGTNLRFFHLIRIDFNKFSHRVLPKFAVLKIR